LAADGTKVILHSEHNIGLAMDTPRGLAVPVLKNVQNKSLMDIAQELAELQAAGAAGKLSEDQLRGCTFSLSNIGSIGGTYAVPVVTPPQVAIGAIGRMQLLPRYRMDIGDGGVGQLASPEAVLGTRGLSGTGALKMVPTAVLFVSWSADHRIVDGATVARFSSTWKGYLESPSKMLFTLK